MREDTNNPITVFILKVNNSKINMQDNMGLPSPDKHCMSWAKSIMIEIKS